MIENMSRREFIAAGAAAGALFALKQTGLAQAATPASTAGGDLNVALVGCGEQGKVLLEACRNIPGIKFRAVCDIWPFNKQYASRWLGKYGHNVTAVAELLNIRQAEVRAFLHGQLPPGRTEELHTQLLAAGVPLSDHLSSVRSA